jgi:hypothetical protein
MKFISLLWIAYALPMLRLHIKSDDVEGYAFFMYSKVDWILNDAFRERNTPVVADACLCTHGDSNYLDRVWPACEGLHRWILVSVARSADRVPMGIS